MTQNPIEICVRPHNGGFLAHAPEDEGHAAWGYSQNEAISNYIIGHCRVIVLPVEEGRDVEGWEFKNGM